MAVVYKHSRFNGVGQSFPVGWHNIDELRKVVGNDQVSSLRVQKGCKAKLFEHGDFKGNQVEFSAGNYDMAAMESAGFKNDQLSSLAVEIDNGCVTLYQHERFGGNSWGYNMGYHDIDVVRRTIGNDQVSSLKVKHGYQARLFQHGGFGGKEIVLGPGWHDISSLRYHGFNDELSSLIVE